MQWDVKMLIGSSITFSSSVIYIIIAACNSDAQSFEVELY